MPSTISELANLAQSCRQDEKHAQPILRHIDVTAFSKRNPLQTFCLLLGWKSSFLGFILAQSLRKGDWCYYSGETGAGKSATANHLVGGEIETSNCKSETRCVTSYTKEVSCEEVNVSGLKFSVVDTPGFNDTDGIDQDACNVCAIKKFCEQNIQLHGRIVYPNAILLCVKSTDNRIDGPQSTFTKNLRTLASLKLIDVKKPNLVIVITHAAAISAGKRKWTEKSNKIADIFQRIVKDTLEFKPPVVFIENEIEDLESDSDQKGTLLPDGTIQPPNLFFELIRIFQHNKDNIALITMREIYRAGSEGEFNKDQEVFANIASEELTPEEKLCQQLLLNNLECHQKVKQLFQQVSSSNFWENLQGGNLASQHF